MAINENESRYRCCCGACRAKIGAIWVAGFEGLVAVTFLVFGIVCQSRTEENDRRYCRVAAPLFFFLAAISVIFVAVLALGLAFKKGSLLIIHMVKCSIFIIFLLIIVCLGIMVVVTAGTGALTIGAVSDSRADRPHEDAKNTFMALTLLAVAAVVIHGVFAILQIWFICIDLAAYRAIRDGNRSRAGVVLSAPQQIITTQTPTVGVGGNYLSDTCQSTTYYPTGQVRASAPPATYEQMSTGYPTSPPPYSEKE